MQQMKNLLFLGALILVHPYPVLAIEPANTVELKIEKPQTLEQQQLEEERKQSNEQMLKFNSFAQESLRQTYANKVQWQGILDEIQSRQIRIKQDRLDRLPRLPIR